MRDNLLQSAVIGPFNVCDWPATKGHVRAPYRYCGKFDRTLSFAALGTEEHGRSSSNTRNIKTPEIVYSDFRKNVLACYSNTKKSHKWLKLIKLVRSKIKLSF